VHPLAFVSQKLTTTQCRWSTIEREAYAIVWALGRFRDLIFGSRIMVFCDHNPLQYIRESASKSAKLLRWSLALAEFDLDITYTKGSENVVADYFVTNMKLLPCVLCYECGSFHGVPKLSWFADELCWLGRVWTVTRQPCRRQPSVCAESCWLCCAVVCDTAMYFLYIYCCYQYVYCM